MKKSWLKAFACTGFLALGLSVATTHLYADEATYSQDREKKMHDGASSAEYINTGVGVAVNKPGEEREKPRTLTGYVDEERDFYKFLLDNHPIFKIYQKDGRVVGKPEISDRTEEFLEINGGKTLEQMTGRPVSVTYRLGMESILDFPNRFVGPEKCGECHPAQYSVWERSRHNKTVRFPDDYEEVGNDLKKGMYGTNTPILTDGFSVDDVYAMIGSPRTKYGFIDNWLVRGTYHIADGNYSDGTGKVVAGGNQFSRVWTENITPEVAKKIAEFSPGFPTKMEDFGKNGSQMWGMNSYGASYKKSFKFQPASSYCEICHTFKFDFKTKDEFFAALGNTKELRKHTISLGITCEECHGAGAHLYGARGAGMPSNCERCHQRFSWNEEDSKINPRKPFNVYFKSACPSCGTEGSQMYSSAHYDEGMRCSTCHDPHEVTKNDWKDGYTLTGLKKTCESCHEEQKEFFKQGGIHAKDNCTGCHMPNMMSCENFAAIQNPDKGGFDNVRASHIWNIKVDKTAKSINPPTGKTRDPMNTKGWTFSRDDNGRFYLDLMWSCGRTSFSDPNLMAPGASGCHSAVQSTLPKNLHFTDQEMIFDEVMKWQLPIKEGFGQIEVGLRSIDRAMANNPTASTEDKAKAILYAKQAQDIKTKLEKDGSWGVHGPQYSKKIVNEALIYIEQAQNILGVNAKKDKK